MVTIKKNKVKKHTTFCQTDCKCAEEKKAKPFLMIETIFKEKIFRISQENIKIELKINSKHIELSGQSDKFIFKSSNSKKTIERWKNILECLLEAIKIAGKERNL